MARESYGNEPAGLPRRSYLESSIQPNREKTVGTSPTAHDLRYQLFHHVSLRHDPVRAAKVVVKLQAVVDAEEAVDGRQDVAGGGRTVGGERPGPVAGSVNEAGFHAAAGEHDGVAIVPVVAAAVVAVDFRRVYSGVLESWLKTDSSAILGRRFEPLELLKT